MEENHVLKASLIINQGQVSPTLKHAHFTSAKSLVSTNSLLNRPSALHSHSTLRITLPSTKHSLSTPALGDVPPHIPSPSHTRAQALCTVPSPRTLLPLLPACRLRTHALRPYLCQSHQF
ncbi:hypothetical protein ARMGADRAFT_1020404, partial [Armillaria gallica]